MALSPGTSLGPYRIIRDMGPCPAGLALGEFVGEMLRGFSLAPDGRSFLTSILRPTSDIWILE